MRKAESIKICAVFLCCIVFMLICCGKKSELEKTKPLCWRKYFMCVRKSICKDSIELCFNVDIFHSRTSINTNSRSTLIYLSALIYSGHFRWMRTLCGWPKILMQVIVWHPFRQSHSMNVYSFIVFNLKVGKKCARKVAKHKNSGIRLANKWQSWLLSERKNWQNTHEQSQSN